MSVSCDWSCCDRECGSSLSLLLELSLIFLWIDGVGEGVAMTRESRSRQKISSSNNYEEHTDKESGVRI